MLSQPLWDKKSYRGPKKLHLGYRIKKKLQRRLQWGTKLTFDFFKKANVTSLHAIVTFQHSNVTFMQFPL
jgi:hypothetical protein